MIEVALHRVDLTQPVDTACLSLDERQRAARLVIPEARRRFVAGRVRLREILAQAVNLPPAALVFAAGEHGKPALSGIPRPPHFNLSHSADLALVAVTSVPVGVDVEHIRPLSALSEMMAMAFTGPERAALASWGESEPLGTFFRLWTCKEAVTKADGSGFRMIQTFEVPFIQRPAGAPLQTAWPPVQIGKFTVQNIHVAKGAAAAVALLNPEARDTSIRLTP